MCNFGLGKATVAPPDSEYIQRKDSVVRVLVFGNG
jgi:hypothetical protein